MARNLTVIEKLEKGARALEMSALGFSRSAIARELQVNRKTVTSLIEVGAEDIDLESPDLERSRAKAHYQRGIREGWRALRNKSLNVNSHNIPALLSQVTNAQARLDKLNGVEAPRKVDLSGQMDLVTFSRMIQDRGLAGRPARERFYEDEDGFIKSRIWHPPPVEEKREAGGERPLMLPPGHLRRRD